MESNYRYYVRRASEERRAAARAVTPEAQARRSALAESFAQLAEQYQRDLGSVLAHG
ncbi:hypothetical protein [Sphingomonas parva]|uniref:hypothetical protein n=1 Tax=Sphingomonas parva TaxID=2555898 RepID=UPI00142FF59B|nr:hypothetical protein [Sphingomonas parva]